MSDSHPSADSAAGGDANWPPADPHWAPPPADDVSSGESGENWPPREQVDLANPGTATAQQAGHQGSYGGAPEGEHMAVHAPYAYPSLPAPTPWPEHEGQSGAQYGADAPTQQWPAGNYDAPHGGQPYNAPPGPAPYTAPPAPAPYNAPVPGHGGQYGDQQGDPYAGPQGDPYAGPQGDPYAGQHGDQYGDQYGGQYGPQYGDQYGGGQYGGQYSAAAGSDYATAPYDAPQWEAPQPRQWESPRWQTYAPTYPQRVDMPAGGQAETITCPECGSVQTISINRRDSEDFCNNCDYPLFWTPSNIQYDRGEMGDQSLRRLPGTVGRAMLASVACPHCSEPNTVQAVVCVRCGLPMHPVEQPRQVYLPPPPPPPVYVEPKTGVAWWVWLLIALTFIATVVLIVLVLSHKIG